MDEAHREGCETAEEAAFGDFPPAFVTVLGSRVTGDSATVWILTNDEPPFEPYTVFCERRAGRWYDDGGASSFCNGSPDQVLAEARRLGA